MNIHKAQNDFAAVQVITPDRNLTAAIGNAQFLISDEAAAFAYGLVEASEGFTAVRTAEENAKLTKLAQDIKAYTRSVEDSRRAVTDPFRLAATSVKAIADEHVRPLEEAYTKLAALSQQWTVQERQRVAKEETERAAEIAKLEAKRTALKTEVAQAKVETKIQAVVAAPAPEVSKARGTVVRKALKWQVTDIKALYAARPELCTVEANAAAIKAICKAGDEVAGLKVWEEESTSFRL